MKSGKQTFKLIWRTSYWEHRGGLMLLYLHMVLKQKDLCNHCCNPGIYIKSIFINCTHTHTQVKTIQYLAISLWMKIKIFSMTSIPMELFKFQGSSLTIRSWFLCFSHCSLSFYRTPCDLPPQGLSYAVSSVGNLLSVLSIYLSPLFIFLIKYHFTRGSFPDT